jgi:hypothetical protein
MGDGASGPINRRVSGSFPPLEGVARGVVHHARLSVARHLGGHPLVQRHMVDRTLDALARWYDQRPDPAEDLHRAESSRWSQNGEDGLLAALVERVGAPTRTFVEIGAADGTENCTRAFAEDGWRGVWFEGDPSRAEKATATVDHLDVDVRQAFVTSGNVDRLLDVASVGEEPDVLVLDIDGSDFWVLRALLRTRSPRILVAEYNATFPPGVFWTRRNRASYQWDESYRHGASLDALAWVAGRHGYRLVACDSSGVNAFFVRGDVADAAGLAPSALDDLYRPLLIKPPVIGHPWRVEPPCPPLESRERVLVRLSDADVVVRGETDRGRYFGLRVRLTNGTDRALTSAGSTPLLVSARAIGAEGEVLDVDCDRSRIAGGMRARSSAVAAAFFVVTDPDVVALRLCLVQEGVAWLDHSTIDCPLSRSDQRSSTPRVSALGTGALHTRV